MAHKNLFTNRNLCIASMHEKEKAIEPVLKSVFGISCCVPEHLNTDTLGTFTGEIERIHSPLTTAIKKCELALEISGNDLAISTEGSFGPHPTLYFLPIHAEIIVLLDKKNNLIIDEGIVSHKTNFSGKYIKNEKELDIFLQLIDFPSHAVILSLEKAEPRYARKGINDKNELIDYFQYLIKFNQSVYIESDMRAMVNPTRMKVIEELAHKLSIKMQSYCPNCSMPGFGIVEFQSGLACENCFLPTKMTKTEISQCKCCQHVQKKQIETLAYAGNCDFCNP
jgi:hypothetical protein